jgi:rRNA processing protein Krr1/Pno1
METITPIQAVKILEAYGTKISLQEAEVVLDFLVKLAIIDITKILENEDNNYG